MPELPEVERDRQTALAALKGRRIAEASGSPDGIVFADHSARKSAAMLVGRRVVDVHRRGKHFWFELDRPPHPLFHLGMTGHLAVYDNRAERPRFWKLVMRTPDGPYLCFYNKRRLGRVRWRDDVEASPPVSLLGPDALTELPPPKVFAEMVGLRKAPVKALLLDQSFLSGIGNWIADEVLFQARIRPQRRADGLSAEETERMRRALRRVVRHAVKVGSDAEQFPATWLFHVRWGKDASARTPAGHPLRFATVGGRTTAWVPAVQK